VAGAACYLYGMLEPAKVDDIVKKVASTTLKRKAVRVYSEPTADSDGHDALSITIVLERGSVDKITGEMAVNTLVGIDKALQAANDDRFPIIDYVTEEELESRDDTEC
jgi:hypothetical protein